MTGKLRCAVLSSLILTALSGMKEGVAQGTTEPLRVRANAAEITLSGRVQAQLNTTSVDGLPPTEAILRRLRLGIDFRINDFISGRIHPELSSSQLSLGDAYGQLNFSPAAQLQVGRFQRPFGTIEEQSSLRILPIERGTRIRGVTDAELSGILSALRYGDRDTGIQLRGAPPGAPLGLSYNLALFAGPLQGTSGDQLTHQAIARLTVAPFDGFSIGAGVNHRQFIDPTEGGDLDGGNAYVINAELGGPAPEPGLHIVAEAATGDYNPVVGEAFKGVQAYTGYRIPGGQRVMVIEPIFRVSYGSVDRVTDTAIRGGTLLTPGLNLYLGGLNRLDAQLRHLEPRSGQDGE